MRAEGPCLTKFVQDSGILDDRFVSDRETIYLGVNGNQVERFRDGEKSYIFKPVGLQQSIGREQWVQDRLVPLLPEVIVPRILAASERKEDRGAWLIYEDLGVLRHGRSAADLVEAAGLIPHWHRLSRSLIPASFRGHSPLFADVCEMVKKDADGLSSRLDGCELRSVEAWVERLPEFTAMIGEDTVASHGDFHPMNVAFLSDTRIVLDWEFIHINHRYWDLYSLLDITSFRYAKVKLTNAERIAALNRYLERAAGNGPEPLLPEFVKGYYIYASVYSAWIAGLIEKDLDAGRAAPEALYRQRRETSEVFADCLFGLGI